MYSTVSLNLVSLRAALSFASIKLLKKAWLSIRLFETFQPTNLGHFLGSAEEHLSDMGGHSPLLF